jgi:hypothetical protein
LLRVYNRDLRNPIASTVASIRPKKDVAKQASKPRRVKGRTEKAEEPFDEAAALERFKALMHKYAGKCSFDGFVD